MINFLSGVIGSVVIFGYLGYFSHLTGISINDLPMKGPDLIFVTIPAAMSHLPLPQLWIIVFFIAFCLIGIDSQLGNMEALSHLTHDLKPTFRGINISEDVIRIFMCILSGLVGVLYATARGFEFIHFVDRYCIFLPFLVIASLKLYLFGGVTSQAVQLQGHGRPAEQVHLGGLPGVRLLLPGLRGDTDIGWGTLVLRNRVHRLFLRIFVADVAGGDRLPGGRVPAVHLLHVALPG